MQSRFEPLLPGHHSDYHAEVTCSYEVNGTRYVSHRISLWSKDLSGDYDSRGFVSTHPEGAAVNVYYRQKPRQRSVLVPGADEEGSKFLIGIGASLRSDGYWGYTSLHSFRRRARFISNSEIGTRGVTLKLSDIEKGNTYFVIHFVVAVILFLTAMVALLTRFLTGPTFGIEAHPKPTWLILCVHCQCGCWCLCSYEAVE